jgi:mono/diheme cytochrome c family protein
MLSRIETIGLRVLGGPWLTICLGAYPFLALTPAHAQPEATNRAQRPVSRPPTASTPSATAALKLFKQNCVQCHGLDGRGEPARNTLPVIPNFTDKAWQQEKSDAQLVISILEGKDRLMPAWSGRISDKQAAEIVRHVIRSFGPARPSQVKIPKGDFENQFDKLRRQQADLQQQFWAGFVTPAIETKSSVGTKLLAFDADRGRDLFIGGKPLANGGPACIVCHTIHGSDRAGGKLGPDLTRVYDRAGGANALVNRLSKSATPAMIAVHQQNALQEEEASSLVAYLQKTAKEGIEEGPGPHLSFLLLGLGGSVVFLGTLDLLRKRLLRLRTRVLQTDLARSVSVPPAIQRQVGDGRYVAST